MSERPATTPPTPPRRSARAIAVMLAGLGVYTALDLASKEWALDNLSRAREGEVPPLCTPDAQGHIYYQRLPTASETFIPGVLKLRYAENCGAAFSFLRTAPAWVRAIVFGVANIIAVVVLGTFFIRGTGGPAFAHAVPLIAAGALGNLSDRVRHGFVVDFIQVDPDLFNYPIFNVADIVIAVGVGLMLIDNFAGPRAAKRAEAAAAKLSQTRV